MTAVGFEPTPLWNVALSHRLRPLGQTVLVCVMKLVYMREAGSGQSNQKAHYLANRGKARCNSVLCSQHFGSVSEILNSRTDDTLAERSRRRPAKPMGSPRVGSNPTGVAYENMIARPPMPVCVSACPSWTRLVHANLQPCLLPTKHGNQDALR